MTIGFYALANRSRGSAIAVNAEAGAFAAGTADVLQFED
jgi:hypothetical protein